MSHKWQERHTNSLFGPSGMRAPVDLFESLGYLNGAAPDVVVAAPSRSHTSDAEDDERSPYFPEEYVSPSPRTSSPHPSVVLSSAVSADGGGMAAVGSGVVMVAVPPSPAIVRRTQYATLDDIVAAVPAVPQAKQGGDVNTATPDANTWHLEGGADAVAPVTQQGNHNRGSAPPANTVDDANSRAVRVQRELLKRTQQQSYMNHLIATLSPTPDGRTRVAAVVDLSASALRTHNYPYSQTVTHPQAAADTNAQHTWYSLQHPILSAASQAQQQGAPSSSPKASGELFVRKGPISRKEVASRHTFQSASNPREAHYFTEVQLFYEALLEVELDDRSLPSGAVKRLTTHLPPEEYHVRRCVLIEKCDNIAVLLSKFHGYEEDLFKMLKAKYNAPAYRFMHPRTS